MHIRLLLYVLFLSLAVHAQKKLVGRVTQEGNAAPVASANVYLSNTSTGTTTDEKGAFTIANFPAGKYELIVSCVGYETWHEFVSSDQLPAQMIIRLQPKIEELQEVILKNDPYDKDGWVKWGHIFLQYFMGTSAFAEDCNLQNNEVLRFRFSEKTNTLKVTARDQLIIENNALGYLLKYTLGKFEFNFDTKEFMYQGFPFFTPMQTTNNRLQNRWIENREIAYKGSLLHFMRSVYDDKIKDEQFQVRQWISVSEAEKKRVREMYDRQMTKRVSRITTINSDNGTSLYVNEKDTSRIISRDTLAYFQNVKKQIKNDLILIDILLPANAISFQYDAESKKMNFPEKIEVVYIPKKNPPEYQRVLTTDNRYGATKSTLTNIPGKLHFFSNGSFAADNAVITAGYWSWWEKMCNKLPYNYKVK